MGSQRKAYLFGSLAVLFWATAATAFKFGLRDLSFFQLLFVANLTSFVILLGFVLMRGEVARVLNSSRRELFYSAFLGLLNPFGYYLILLKAYSLLPAQVAQPLNFVWPVVLAFLAVPVLGRKLSGWSIVALLVSFIGVAIISSQGDFSSLERSSPVGVALALSSSLLWASFWVFNVKDKRPEEIKLFLCFFFSLLYLLVVSPFIPDFYSISAKGIPAGIYVGCFEMGFTFLFWLKALSLSKSTDKLGNIVFIVPFLSLVFIHFVVGESLCWTTFAGLLIILLSVVFQQVIDKKAQHG